MKRFLVVPLFVSLILVVFGAAIAFASEPEPNVVEALDTVFIDGFITDGISSGDEITTSQSIKIGVAIYNASRTDVPITVKIPWSFGILTWVRNGTQNGNTGELLEGSWRSYGGEQIFEGFLPCRAPLASGCQSAGTPDFVFVEFTPRDYGDVSLQISVIEAGFLSKSEVLTLHVREETQPYWVPILISVNPTEVRSGDSQILEGTKFLPPNTGEYGETFVAYLLPGHTVTEQVFGEIQSLSETEIDVIVPQLEPGPVKVYVGWPLLDGTGWEVSSWMDVTILPPTPNAVTVSKFTAETRSVSWWENVVDWISNLR